MNKFIRNEAELLIPHVAGGVYYRDLARERARLRNCVIDENNQHWAECAPLFLSLS